jgi:hypothetical protein
MCVCVLRFFNLVTSCQKTFLLSGQNMRKKISSN